MKTNPPQNPQTVICPVVSQYLNKGDQVKNVIGFFMTAGLLLFLGGIGNGAMSYRNGCYNQYLNFRAPIHYVLFPHTIGYYTGRVLAFKYGQKRDYKTICDTIFNQTLEGPAND